MRLNLTAGWYLNNCICSEGTATDETLGRQHPGNTGARCVFAFLEPAPGEGQTRKTDVWEAPPSEREPKLWEDQDCHRGANYFQRGEKRLMPQGTDACMQDTHGERLWGMGKDMSGFFALDGPQPPTETQMVPKCVHGALPLLQSQKDCFFYFFLVFRYFFQLAASFPLFPAGACRVSLVPPGTRSPAPVPDRPTPVPDRDWRGTEDVSERCGGADALRLRCGEIGRLWETDGASAEREGARRRRGRACYFF